MKMSGLTKQSLSSILTNPPLVRPAFSIFQTNLVSFKYLSLLLLKIYTLAESYELWERYIYRTRNHNHQEAVFKTLIVLV